jgi:hypothetical protein
MPPSSACFFLVSSLMNSLTLNKENVDYPDTSVGIYQTRWRYIWDNSTIRRFRLSPYSWWLHNGFTLRRPKLRGTHVYQKIGDIKGPRARVAFRTPLKAYHSQAFWKNTLRLSSTTRTTSVLKYAFLWDVTPCFSETSVLTRATRRNIPEDGIPLSHCRENLKS